MHLLCAKCRPDFQDKPFEGFHSSGLEFNLCVKRTKVQFVQTLYQRPEHGKWAWQNKQVQITQLIIVCQALFCEVGEAANWVPSACTLGTIVPTNSNRIFGLVWDKYEKNQIYRHHTPSMQTSATTCQLSQWHVAPNMCRCFRAKKASVVGIEPWTRLSYIQIPLMQRYYYNINLPTLN